MNRTARPAHAIGNRVESTDAKGNLVNRTEIDVDADGAPMAPRTTLYAYDALDRLVAVTDPLERVMRQGYDSRGNQAWSLDAKGNRVDFVYDAQDRLVATVREMRTDGVGSGALLGFVNTTQDWDADGRLVRQTDDSGFNTTYEYDSFGRLARTMFADGTNESHEYDARGLRVATTKPDGTVVRQGYDEVGHLVSRAAEGQFPVAQSFEHDGMGRVTQATDGSHVLAFAYDSLGNQVQEAQGGLTVSRTFDGVGNALTLTYPNGRTLNRQTDLLGRLGEVSDASGLLASFTYEGAGRIASRTAGNGVVTTYTYDAAEQVTSIDHALPNLARPFRFEYDYDGNGNRMQELLHHAPDWSKAASFDSLGRLTAVQRGNVDNLPAPPNPLEGILAQHQAWTLDGGNEWDAFANPQGCVKEKWRGTYQYPEAGRIGECLGLVGAVLELGSFTFSLGRSAGRFTTRFLADDVARLVADDTAELAPRAGNSAADAGHEANEKLIRGAARSLDLGTSSNVRVVDSEAELKALHDSWTKGGSLWKATENGYLTKLSDGTIVGWRAASKSGGPAVDVSFTNGKALKVHVRSK